MRYAQALLIRQDPDAWLLGFDLARLWVDDLARPGQAEAIFHVIRLSLWPAFGYPERTPFTEGLFLGIFGIIAAEMAARGKPVTLNPRPFA